MHYYDNEKLSWSKRAAEEPEKIASMSCSGHGRAYIDGYISVDGQPICECYSCYTGTDCSLFFPNCSADAESGDPLFLEPFWMQNAASSPVVVAGWHRMSYVFPNHSIISKELEKNIRKIHAIANNATTDGKYIVFGVGSTQLLYAAVHALSMDRYSTKVVANKIPYYSVGYLRDVNLYRRMMEFIGLAKMGTSKDVQLRVLTLLKVVAQGDGKQLFNFAQQILRDRWEKLSHIFSITKRVSLQKVPTQYCTFLERAREPSPAYAWVDCKRKEDKNCEEVFRVAKIIGRPGRKFLAEDRHVRLSLLKSQHDFDMLIHRLKELVSQEYEASAQAMSSF